MPKVFGRKRQKFSYPKDEQVVLSDNSLAGYCYSGWLVVSIMLLATPLMTEDVVGPRAPME